MGLFPGREKEELNPEERKFFEKERVKRVSALNKELEKIFEKENPTDGDWYSE